MKKVLASLALMFASVLGVCQVQNNNLPDCQRGFSFQVVSNVITAIKDDTGQTLPAGSSKIYDNRPGRSTATGCTVWHLQYTIETGSSFSALSLDVQTTSFPGDILSNSFSTWTAANVSGTLPMTLTTGINKVISMFGSPDFVRVFLSSATGTGIISGQLIGWRPQSASDTSNSAAPVNPANFLFNHISSNTNTQIKATPGYLHAVAINLTAAGTITIKDTSASNCSGGTTIGIITLFASAAPGPIPSMIYDVQFNSGLCITTSASPDLTVSFK